MFIGYEAHSSLYPCTSPQKQTVGCLDEVCCLFGAIFSVFRGKRPAILIANQLQLHTSSKIREFIPSLPLPADLTLRFLLLLAISPFGLVSFEYVPLFQGV